MYQRERCFHMRIVNWVYYQDLGSKTLGTLKVLERFNDNKDQILMMLHDVDVCTPK